MSPFGTMHINWKPLELPPSSYYITRWLKGMNALITRLPPSRGDWLKKFFFFDVATCDPRLRRHYKLACVFWSPFVILFELIKILQLTFLFFPGAPKHGDLTVEELEELDIMYNLGDRSYDHIRGDRIIKLNMKFQKYPKLKALAIAKNAKIVTPSSMSPEIRLSQQKRKGIVIEEEPKH